MRCDDSQEVNSLIEECVSESEKCISAKVCYRIYDITVDSLNVSCDSFSFASGDLCKCLKNCEKLVMFAATIGIGFDRLIARYSSLSPSKAVCLHALGSERIEALCDVFCDEIMKQDALNGKKLTPRFSPGYGDLDICNQKVFDSLLMLNQSCGISFNSSLLMTPSKSVTAVAGIR